ncbi:hypothetical protein Tco_0800735 [Tanacetum coccineum]|uniref:Uncharacterized protein n=1 Tax=Tanacetum coccineum TaxID=301880 RepID=A0ABQ4ZUZ1_9ASTR
MINPAQTWRPKGAYLDFVNRDNGSYTLKLFEAIPKKISKTKHIQIRHHFIRDCYEQRLINVVNYVEELKFNLLSVSQICDKKHNVLFTDKECLILSPKFKFVDEDLVMSLTPRKNECNSQDLRISYAFWRSKLSIGLQGQQGLSSPNSQKICLLARRLKKEQSDDTYENLLHNGILFEDLFQ